MPRDFPVVLSLILCVMLMACLASLLLSRGVRLLARRRGFVDRPDGRRKMQSGGIALGGGVAVFLAVVLALLVSTVVFELHWIFRSRDWSLAGLGCAATLLCLVGFIDDRYGMRGSVKLLAQVVAATIIVGSGLMLTRLTIGGTTFQLGFFGVLVTIFWILGAINSLNLIDGSDGVATTIGIVFSVVLGMIALYYGHLVDAVIVFAFAGALAGFLPFNFPPATMYLGDAGSLTIGLVLGTLALRCSMKEAATLAFAAPLALWAIPIFDSVAAVLRRKLTGRSIYDTDRGHIHHRLLTSGLSARQALGIIVVLCLFTAGGSLMGVYLENGMYGIVTAGGVLAALIATRVFGHSELLLLNARLRGLGYYFVPTGSKSEKSGHRSSLQLQGSMEWENLWGALLESVDRFHLVRVQLNVVLPSLHEDFFATWKRKGNGYDHDHIWRVEIPLDAGGGVVGRLHVAGERMADSAAADIGLFLDFVEPMAAHLRELIADAERKQAERKAGDANSERAEEPQAESPPASSTTTDAIAAKT